jgi:hypothetical protein
MNYSKGQYRLVSEILLFGIGILITGYVIINFNALQDSVRDLTLKDQMNNIADLVSTAIVKIATADNASIRLTIPGTLSDSPYRISIKDADGGKLIISRLDGSALVERQLFNINYNNTISSNVINNSEVVSSAQFIEIVKNEKITILRR